MKASKVAFAGFVTAAAMAATPALAQQSGAQEQNRQDRASRSGGGQQPAQQAPTYNLSRAERAAIVPLDEAVRAASAAPQADRAPLWQTARGLLPAAQTAARGNDARFLIARSAYQIALGLADVPGQATALDQIIALPNVPPPLMISALNSRASIAFDAQDFATAERSFVRLSELEPTNQQYTNNLAIVRRRMGNSSGALAPLLAQIQAAETANQAVPEESYRRALLLAGEARDAATTNRLRNALLRAYPTPQNWRAAIDSARAGQTTDDAFTLDALRLMRATGSLVQRNDYLAYAQMASRSGLPGEVNAAINEGQQRNIYQSGDAAFASLRESADRGLAEDRRDLTGAIAAARRPAATGREARNTGDALFGYGRYAEAVALYRVAQGKTGEDANLLNTRIGAALAMAGNRAEAETALRAVTGPRQALAELWMIWLARRAS